MSANTKARPKEGIPHITCEHLRNLRATDKEHVVLDISNHADFETGHIAGSLHVPRRELATNVVNLIPDKERKVVVVFGATQEPEIEDIYAQLYGLGYRNIEFLAGGFDRWCEIAPLEIEADLTELTPEEEGFVGEELSHIDPEEKEGEPLY